MSKDSKSQTHPKAESPADSMAEIVEENSIEIIFSTDSRKYWIQNTEGEWVSKDSLQLQRHLKFQGFSPVTNHKAHETVSQIDRMMHKSETYNTVAYAGPLAGYHAGIRYLEGERVLITRSPNLIVPKEGDWPTLKDYFAGLLFSEEDQVDQRPYFFGFAKHYLESIYSGKWSRGLCLALAGDPGSGKSLLFDLLRLMVGGKVEKPYRYMIGKDNFNAELFEAPLLLIDDESADTSITARKTFAANIKQIVAANSSRCRGLHQKGVSLKPTWRIGICVNLELENLLVLPPLDDDIQDKILLLKAYKSPMPMPCGTESDRRSFWGRLISELPAFIHFLLNEWTIKPEMEGRFGVIHFHHPDIKAALHELSPEMRLHSQIERVILSHQDFWRGSTTDLEAALRNPDNGLTRDEIRKIPPAAWIGRHLAKLHACLGPRRYQHRKTSTVQTWSIYRADFNWDMDRRAK